jgi:hypothetical protein
VLVAAKVIAEIFFSSTAFDYLGQRIVSKQPTGQRSDLQEVGQYSLLPWMIA